MRKLLVVEDDDLSIKVMRRIFQNDFEIFFCDSADEYYEKFSNANYSMIIMDISIKGNKSGMDLIKEIKAAPFHADTPILCLTAHSQTRVREEAEKSGSDLFITKPVNNKILKEAVEVLLDAKKPEFS